jgi:uncharacterized OB-fold protein
MTTDSYRSKLPAVDAEYWDGPDAGELRLQQCGNCGYTRFPPAATCPRCLSGDYTWHVSTGHGVLWSWIRVHRKYFAAFEDRLPYNVAMIQLDDGPRLISSIIEDGEHELRCGARVEAAFERRSGEFTLPEFRIVSEEAA